MVDSQAEFLSIMTIWLALRARNDRSIWLFILTGMTLGAAYWVRHTQIVLAFSLLILLWTWNASTGYRIRAISVCSAAALAVGIGDLWYHQNYLGGWLHPESEELALYSLSAIADSANSLFQQGFAANEFGWLAPLLIYGSLQFARRAKVEFVALIAWLCLSLAFHLPYAAVRLRDLLPEFPAFAFLAAYGLCVLAVQVLTSPKRGWAAGIVLFSVFELSILRGWNILPRAWQPAEPIFGYMSRSQRDAFDQLAAITPRDAVIGSTLNDGAIDLYSKRETFRPDAWTAPERRQFLNAVTTAHPSVYLLEDSTAMDAVLDDLGHDLSIRRVATLDVPLFGGGPVRNPGALWLIEE